jgi:ribosome assembly protein YihI (activator of Der GTPase)
MIITTSWSMCPCSLTCLLLRPQIRLNVLDAIDLSNILAKLENNGRWSEENQSFFYDILNRIL